MMLVNNDKDLKNLKLSTEQQGKRLLLFYVNQVTEEKGENDLRL